MRGKPICVFAATMCSQLPSALVSHSHFEVISRGPQSTETAPPEKSSPSIAAQAVEQDGGLGSHDDGFPWAGGSARAKQLASVAEERSESSSQAILPSEQAEVSGLASSTGPGLTSLTRTSSLAAAPGVPEASKTRPSSVPPKTNRQPGMTSKVKVQDRSACDYASRNQAAMEPNGPSMLQRWCEKVTKARLGSCFRKAPYPLSPRRLQKHRSMEAPAGASVPYGRLRKALERAEELKVSRSERLRKTNESANKPGISMNGRWLSRKRRCYMSSVRAFS